MNKQNAALFNQIFGDDHDSELANAAIEMYKAKTKRQTFGMNLVENFFNFLSFIFAKIVPACHMFTIIFDNIVNGKFPVSSLKEAWSTVVCKSIPTCSYIILVGVVLWAIIELMKIVVLFFLNVCYSLELRSLTKKVAVLQKGIKEHLKKEDEKTKKEEDEKRKTSTCEPRLQHLDTREGYSDEEIVAHANELLEKDKNSNKAKQ